MSATNQESLVEQSAAPATIRLDLKHPIAIRWMHWVNFPVLFTMIWSGLLIYWNDSDNAYQYPHRVYRIGIGHFTLFRFFPDLVLSGSSHAVSRDPGAWISFLLHVDLCLEWRALRSVYMALRGMAVSAARAAQRKGRDSGNAGRLASSQGLATAKKVQRRPTHRVHVGDPDGSRHVDDRIGHL